MASKNIIRHAAEHLGRVWEDSVVTIDDQIILDIANRQARIEYRRYTDDTLTYEILPRQAMIVEIDPLSEGSVYFTKLAQALGEGATVDTITVPDPTPEPAPEEGEGA